MSQLTDVRLNIMDPTGVLYFETVTELPTVLIPQTAYIIDGQYYVDGVQTDLKISDDRINGWLGVLDATTDSVTLKALKVCRAYLKAELAIKKTSSGADSDEYQDLLSLWQVYNAEIIDKEEDVAAAKVVVKSRRYQQFNTPSWVAET